MSEQYVIESSDGPLQLSAPDDITAVAKARAWCEERRIQCFSLWRYPLYAIAPKGYKRFIPAGVLRCFDTDMIWVPLLSMMQVRR